MSLPHRLTYLITTMLLISQLSCLAKPEVLTITDVNTITKINNNWQLTIIDCPNGQLKGQKFQVHLPTTIHLDLLKNGKIQDPFYRDNYRTLQWVSHCNIKYSKKFHIVKPKLNVLTSEQEQSLQQLSQAEIQIIFQGIDTYSKIVFNGVELIQTHNAFQAYTLNIKNAKFGQQQQNLLQVYIEPVQKYDSQGQQKNNMPFKYAHTRKACYQYSWDWAPELVTMGIWKDVQIMFWDGIRFDYVWARNRIISEQRVVINFALKLQQTQYTNFKNYFVVVKEKNGKQLGRQDLKADTAYIDVQILKPKFWWPNGFGQPHMYDFQVQLYCFSDTNKKIDSRAVAYGIRTAQLDLSNKKFTVKINGYPVYCKGANYVPMDMFHPRITNQGHHSNKTYTYIKLLEDAVLSNFNMIRLWGGGQYQTNQFLELASRKGIMIFYDFKFSDSIYPSSKQFLHNVEQEIKQQIRRARNYPALTLWCGNNQILQGIQDWGWGSGKYREDYKLLFQNLIKKVVEIENPDISYIPSSPIYGVGNYGFERGGDFHYWSVWAGGAAFESYQTAVGPFNSQFGTQALPVWESIKQFTEEGDRSYQSPVLLTHERHNSQFGTLRNYMRMYAKPSKNFENQAYLSGIVQAFGIQIAIRAQRTSKPKSYGTLYWQFNDAWPAISWSSIDYYGRWKPLQFMAKRLYPNVAIFTLNNDSVVAINDNIMSVDVKAKVCVVQFDGTVITQQQKLITLPADSVTSIFTLTSKQIKQKPNSILTYTQIYQNNILKMYSTKFYKPFKDLELPQATVTIKQGQSKTTLLISSDKLVKNIFLNIPNSTIRFDDNYFDVVPGFTSRVQILKGNNGVLYDYGYVKANAKFMSVRDSSQKQDLKVVFQ